MATQVYVRTLRHFGCLVVWLVVGLVVTTDQSLDWYACWLVVYLVVPYQDY